MTNKTLSGAENHQNQKAAKLPKYIFFLAQYCVNLSRWFLHENAAFKLSSARLHCSFTTLNSHKMLVNTHSTTMALFWIPFSSFVCMS